jgi:hypothetical protein
MDNTSNISPVTVLAAYAQGQNDGFKAGIILAVGVYAVARMYHRGRIRRAKETKFTFGKN